MGLRAFPRVVGGDAPARQVEGCAEHDDDHDQDEGDVVTECGQVAQGGEAGQKALLEGQLPEGARLGQQGEITARRPSSLMKTERLAGRPAEDGEADDDGDQAAGLPDAPGRVADDSDVTGKVEDLLEDATSGP